MSPSHANINCSWLITKQLRSYIALEFSYIEVKSMNIDCYCINILCISLKQLESGFDYLRIFDGGSQHSDLIYNITGSYINTKVSIPGNQMYVVFETRLSVTKKGFKASIQDLGKIKIFFGNQKYEC